VSGLSTAVGFYTRVPVRAATSGAGDLAAAAPWFPVVGAAIGLTVAGVYAGLGAFLPGMLAATVAVAVGALLTGAFHEDGLADVADAFGGGWTVERRLEILADPRLGTFGVMAVAIAMLARVTAIATLDSPAALALLPAAHALSRAPAVVLMRRQRSARPDGLAATLARGIGAAEEGIAVAVAVAVGLALIGVWAGPAVAGVAVVSGAMAALAHRKIGGTNGDVLGATQQLAEVTVLLVGVAVVHNGWGDLPWWSP
jgi:adenosylcobinamide-GDP ribazoletransferase